MDAVKTRFLVDAAASRHASGLCVERILRPVMRIILDECLTRRLKRELPGHDVATVREKGWAGKKNGEFLKLLEPVCDVFITIDGNLTYQQNLSAAAVSKGSCAASDEADSRVKSRA